ncbi:methionine aminopeptidase 2-like protein [Bimuria novae-zelandiae CBS 107.79]|uniref:Methionine aminopeptidase 2 n=1 Tax=Bimuria novae-zelandiae CBS 107.79 TaxID=1447943 RepID=A0A6A5V4T8_9PLEO|nr:methionine aminopeptidase 2-like protein [Bimuria novae-zelandiae CBS 107.79]
MGSKTPEGHHQAPNGHPAHAAIVSPNPPKPAAANGLLQAAIEGEDEDGDDDDDTKDGIESKVNGASDMQKKKRKRSKNKKNKTPVNQTVLPRVALTSIFANKQYPTGEIIEQVADGNLQRTTAEELRHLAVLHDMDDEFLSDYRKAAEVHRQVRKHVQAIAKPGISMTELAHEIEDAVRALVGHQGIEPGDALKAGMGFPTGLCLNHVAAHWTPNAGNKEVVLQYEDVLKVDFGVHVNGRIVDSAFTIAFNPVYDPLLEAAKATTNAGLKEAGVDARMDNLSEIMQEVMESYEVELNGKTIPIKAVRNISGHNILRYKIHGDKQVPFYKTKTNQRMEEGDIFAIETFGTTGKARMMDDVGIYGYGRNENVSTTGLHHASAKSLLKTIDTNFGTIVFAKRYLERIGAKNYHLGMRSLVQHGVVESYAPLVDVPGSYVAQFEHTVLLHPGCKEIVSRGDDY